MKSISHRCIAALTLCLGICQAAVIRPLPASIGSSAESIARISVKGEIRKGDAEQIRLLIPNAMKTSRAAQDGFPSHHQVPVVLLSSPGGDVREALVIGRLLRSYNATVIVTSECVSACVLALAGGASRVVTQLPSYGHTRLGIHRIRPVGAATLKQSPAEVMSEYNRMKKETTEYLTEMGISIRLAEMMYRVGSEEIYYLNDREANDWSISGVDPAFAEYMRAKDIQVFGAACVETRDRFFTCLQSGQEDGTCRHKVDFTPCSPANK